MCKAHPSVPADEFGFECNFRTGKGLKNISVLAHISGQEICLGKRLIYFCPSSTVKEGTQSSIGYPLKTYSAGAFLGNKKNIEYPAVVEKKSVDVVIPIYKGLDETKKCVERVLKSESSIPFNLILVNDCSPDLGITEYLSSIEGQESVVILSNNENLGFVGSVNRGMQYTTNHDVLLLNSDTEVCGDWLDKIANHAYSSSKVGTVTPLSNNATICSYPSFEGTSTLAYNASLERMNSVCEEVNPAVNIEIPTAVGFCMYIRRDCLDDIGLFDESAFGKGYGEENDFCLRATKKGWKHLLAYDVFVYHIGEISFAESGAIGKKNALKVIAERYPNYQKNIASFIAEDPGFPHRITLSAGLIKRSSKEKRLIITHNRGGGVEKFVQDRIKTEKNIQFIVLRPVRGKVELCFDTEFETQRISLEKDDIKQFAQLIKLFDINLIELNHVIEIHIFLKNLLAELNLPWAFYMHDYYSFCPTINFWNYKEVYCEEPEDADICNKCLKELVREKKITNPTWGPDITRWREDQGWFISNATRVICPSFDVENRVKRYCPEAKTKVKYHEALKHPRREEVADISKKKGPIKIAVIGAIDNRKGLSILNELNHACEDLQVILKVIGYTADRDTNPNPISQTGEYNEEDLGKLIEKYAPDIFLFPSQLPETYSYTLSTAIRAKKLIIAPKLGAFRERLADYPQTLLYDHKDAVNQIKILILELIGLDGSASTNSSVDINMKTRQCRSFERR